MSRRARDIANRAMGMLKATPGDVRTLKQAREAQADVLKRMGWDNIRSPNRQQVQGWSGDVSITVTYDIRSKDIREIIVEHDITGKQKSVPAVIRPDRAAKLVSGSVR